MNADRRPDEVLSEIEPRFLCAACGKRGAEVRPASWCDLARFVLEDFGKRLCPIPTARPCFGQYAAPLRIVAFRPSPV
jgi:hypothetical protein